MATFFKNKGILKQPYKNKKRCNAVQLQRILNGKSAFAFKQGSFEDNGVVNKCSAYARKFFKGNPNIAMELLLLGGEHAEKRRQKSITDKNVDFAFRKLRRQ